MCVCVYIYVISKYNMYVTFTNVAVDSSPTSNIKVQQYIIAILVYLMINL